MGAQHDGPVTLPPAEYWRLRFLACDAELARARADLVVARAEARLRAAWPSSAAPETAYVWDDAGCALVPPGPEDPC